MANQQQVQQRTLLKLILLTVLRKTKGSAMKQSSFVKSSVLICTKTDNTATAEHLKRRYCIQFNITLSFLVFYLYLKKNILCNESFKQWRNNVVLKTWKGTAYLRIRTKYCVILSVIICQKNFPGDTFRTISMFI